MTNDPADISILFVHFSTSTLYFPVSHPFSIYKGITTTTVSILRLHRCHLQEHTKVSGVIDRGLLPSSTTIILIHHGPMWSSTHLPSSGTISQVYHGVERAVNGWHRSRTEEYDDFLVCLTEKKKRPEPMMSSL